MKVQVNLKTLSQDEILFPNDSALNTEHTHPHLARSCSGAVPTSFRQPLGAESRIHSTNGSAFVGLSPVASFLLPPPACLLLPQPPEGPSPKCTTHSPFSLLGHPPAPLEASCLA